MTDTPPSTDAVLVADFQKAMLQTYEDAKRHYGYNATYFLRMVHEHGGVGAAKRLLQSQDVPSGLMKLWECAQRGGPGLALSTEALVLQPRWRALFTAEELNEATTRLKALDYHIPDAPGAKTDA